MRSGLLDGRVVMVTGGGSGLGQASPSDCRRRAHVVSPISTKPRPGESLRRSEVRSPCSTSPILWLSTRPSIGWNRTTDASTSWSTRRHRSPASPERTEISIANQMKRMEGRTDELIPTDATVGLTDADWDRMIRVHLYGSSMGPSRSASHDPSPIGFGDQRVVDSRTPADGRRTSLRGSQSGNRRILQVGRPGKSRRSEVRVNTVCPVGSTRHFCRLWTLSSSTRFACRSGGRMGTRVNLPKSYVSRRPESSYCIGDVFAASGGWV